MRVPHWLRPLTAGRNRTPARRAQHRPAFRPRVEGLEDRSVPAVFTVTTTADNVAGSLRQASLDANDVVGADTINFAIPAGQQSPGGWWTIQPLSPLPDVTSSGAVIDGWSQGGVGYHGPPRIALDGTFAGPANGLVLRGGSTVRGLAITNFGVFHAPPPNGYGIEIFGVGNTVQGCYLGLDPTGTTAAGNIQGLQNWGRDTVIGGDRNLGEGNVISGNDFYNFGSLGYGATVIRGNFVGTNASGSAALPGDAFALTGGPRGLGVEGDDANSTTQIIDNVISGHVGGGMSVSRMTGPVYIPGNRIGTDVSGTYTIPNQGGAGLVVFPNVSTVVIGGTDLASRNIISGNGIGVALVAPNLTGVRVQGNYIGTDATGAVNLGNDGVGIAGSGDGCLIGGTDPGAGNLIAGNLNDGGVFMHGSNNRIVGNVLHHNKWGVAIDNRVSGQGNTVSANSIYANTQLGIDLQPATGGGNTAVGLTPNDALDADTGPNGLQNFPELAAATRTASGITVTGNLPSKASTQYRIEFFASQAADSSGFGEGQRYLGSCIVTTDANGNATITANLPVLQAGEGIVTATATDLATGDTSEFSHWVEVPTNTAPTANAGGPYTVVRGGIVTLDASATNDLEQAKTTLLYEWDFDGDTQYDDATGMTPTFSAAGFNTPQTITVGLRVTDNGGLTGTATATVHVVAVALLPDPCEPGAVSLFVGGTTGNDNIDITPSGGGGAVEVEVNGTSLGTFTPTGRIVVFAQAGNDDVRLSGSIDHPAWLYGDAGDDRLKGGAGDDVLLGGDGDDLLHGHSGRDLLVGGRGADRIVGNADEDILIAGLTSHDATPSALCAVMHEWTRTDRTAEQRVENLRNGTGLNGSVVLTATTVFSDTDADVLTGSSGYDWFLFDDTRDRVTDLSDEAFTNDLPFILD